MKRINYSACYRVEQQVEISMAPPSSQTEKFEYRQEMQQVKISFSRGKKTHLAVRIRYINRISFLLFKSAEQVSQSVDATNSKFSRRRFPLEEKQPSNSTTIQTRFTFPQNICSTHKQFLNYSEFFRFHPICKSDSNLHFIKKFKIFNKKKIH